MQANEKMLEEIRHDSRRLEVVFSDGTTLILEALSEGCEIFYTTPRYLRVEYSSCSEAEREAEVLPGGSLM